MKFRFKNPCYHLSIVFMLVGMLIYPKGEILCFSSNTTLISDTQHVDACDPHAHLEHTHSMEHSGQNKFSCEDHSCLDLLSLKLFEQPRNLFSNISKSVAQKIVYSGSSILNSRTCLSDPLEAYARLSSFSRNLSSRNSHLIFKKVTVLVI